MTVNDFYKSIFGSKTYKISLNAGCTCPTRDGTLGKGGCIFCSAAGSGDFTPQASSIPEQIESAKSLLAPKLKYRNIKYIAYFQSFTNTYGDFSRLRQLWEQALSDPEVCGLALGTRPDCLSEECVEYLAHLAESTFVQVELGLQTSNEKTGEYIRRCFTNDIFWQAVQRLKKANPNIHVAAHLIFGLPGDGCEDMLDSVRFVAASGCQGIKITCLYVLKGTDLETELAAGKFKCLGMDEYFDLIEQALKLIPVTMVIHRLTGDPPKALLIEPKWTERKKQVLNRVNRLLSGAC